MKIHCIRHEPFEGLGYIEDWIKKSRHSLEYTLIYKNEAFPETIDFDMLIVMGGTASVYEESKYKWILEEKKFIRNVLGKSKKILGICFGAQIIASVLGSRVYPGTCKEIGWFPVRFKKELLNDFQFLPEDITSFHWHGDTFDIPPGALHIASSACTPNQGFIMGEQVVALQFHPEMNRKAVHSLLSVAGNELVPESYIQSKEEILREDYFKENNQLMLKFLEYLSRNITK